MLNNDLIIKYICKRFNIDLSKYDPMDEDGNITDKSFDKRFNLDRVYLRTFKNFKTRIRIVKYSSNQIYLYKLKLRLSNILKHEYELNHYRVYTLENRYIISPKEIYRWIKLKKIRNV